MSYCEAGDHLLESNRSNAVALEEHLLVREITHRINNELTSAIGVATLTASRSKNNEVKVALAGVIDVLYNFARVHRALEMPTQATSRDAAEYLRSLFQCISRSKLSHRGIQLVFVESPIQLSSERCWRLGMIASELITNAERHAFGDGGGTIRVELSSSGNYVVFRVEDASESRLSQAEARRSFRRWPGASTERSPKDSVTTAQSQLWSSRTSRKVFVWTDT